MDALAAFIAKLWRFVSFLPFFFFLFILGIMKGTVIGPIAFAIIVIGNLAVIIGLWTAHVVWTYYCVARTKRFGLVLKVVILICLPVPVLLLPILGIVGSLLGGIGYGYCAPLLATFEAVGQDVKDKFYHCFIDGCWSTIKRSCTVVQDVTDFCFHSYFSYMDELRENLPSHEKPFDIKLSILPCCLLVILVAVPFDVVLITSIAIWKSPYMLFIGWKRLLEDLIGREGPFLETECVPFAGLAIILWPLAVVGAVLAACISSLFLGLYGGIVVHQVWDWLFKSCEVNGRILLRDGLISVKEIEECILKGNCKKLGIKLPAWSLMHCLLTSAKCDTDGLVISDDEELTRMNGPRDKVFEWFIGPLLIMKDQLKKLKLEETEETCLKELVMRCKNELPEEWDSTGFPSSDTVRRAQLQAIIRRLQGIVTSMSQIPTFRRRFMNLVKVLYIEALQARASANHIGGSAIPKHSEKDSPC
ncbi:hypothetical protein TanjilG_25075 [Lupinus angustifolius]|uniref:Transmembrane protein n=1 Tax=Lupinus angustifolius TaxID=3871 RepID=A0A394DCR7_LUPAN|nr:hypothetical protein TanjilG_25075 [Lupinus angustifolius]